MSRELFCSDTPVMQLLNFLSLQLPMDSSSPPSNDSLSRTFFPSDLCYSLNEVARTVTDCFCSLSTELFDLESAEGDELQVLSFSAVAFGWYITSVLDFGLY